MFQKTKSFFHRTLRRLKSIILQAGKKLPIPKPHFSCTFCRSNSLDVGDNFYSSFLNLWESDLKNSIGVPLKLEQNAQEQEQNQEKKTEACSSRGYDTMEKKIKEMYMIETGDIEQELDVEEALHYYSRLQSPVYLNIVDNFFNDLYS